MDGQTDRRTDMMKLIDAFRNFANTPKILTSIANIVGIDRLFDYVSVYAKQRSVSVAFSCEPKRKRTFARHGCEENINGNLKELWTGFMWLSGAPLANCCNHGNDIFGFVFWRIS